MTKATASGGSGACQQQLAGPVGVHSKKATMRPARLRMGRTALGVARLAGSKVGTLEQVLVRRAARLDGIELDDR